tara:strand:- start:131 stop:865 length:735 start_codon:yes stop_codon:yes gene_type:complete
MAEFIGTTSKRILRNILDNSFKAGKINAKDYRALQKKHGLGKPRIVQLDLFKGPQKKQKGGVMEAINGLKAKGLKKGGKPSKPMVKKKNPQRVAPARPGQKTKELTPQQKKEMMDKLKKMRGQITNPFIKLDSLGRPTMEAKRGGATKKFPDLSGDGKVTMKDVLMGRGVIKKPKKKADGGSMTLEGGKLKNVKDAPEERRREVRKKVKTMLQRRSLLNPMGGSRGFGKVAGRLAKRGYGIARK